jgi:uncharacterized protein (UPF0261 family)
MPHPMHPLGQQARRNMAAFMGGAGGGGAEEMSDMFSGAPLCLPWLHGVSHLACESILPAFLEHTAL